MELTILIALTTNWLMENPHYQYLLNRLRLNIKPFNCLYCLTFWLGLIVFIIKGEYTIINMALQPSAASFLAVLLSKAYKALPMKI